jgi:hypothetical protein
MIYYAMKEIKEFAITLIHVYLADNLSDQSPKHVVENQNVLSYLKNMLRL